MRGWERQGRGRELLEEASHVSDFEMMEGGFICKFFECRFRTYLWGRRRGRGEESVAAEVRGEQVGGRGRRRRRQEDMVAGDRGRGRRWRGQEEGRRRRAGPLPLHQGDGIVVCKAIEETVNSLHASCFQGRQ